MEKENFIWSRISPPFMNANSALSMDSKEQTELEPKRFSFQKWKLLYGVILFILDLFSH